MGAGGQGGGGGAGGGGGGGETVTLITYHKEVDSKHMRRLL